MKESFGNFDAGKICYLINSLTIKFRRENQKHSNSVVNNNNKYSNQHTGKRKSDTMESSDETTGPRSNNESSSKQKTSPELDGPILDVASPKDWLRLNGRLHVGAQGVKSCVPCILAVGPEGKKTNIKITGDKTKNFSERVEFASDLFKDSSGNANKKYDLSCREIGALCKEMVEKGLTDSELAIGILLNMRGESREKYLNHSSFYSSMSVYLFGIEASRNLAILLVGLMMLDLIANKKYYGRGMKKPFTLQNAFGPENKLKWDFHPSNDESSNSKRPYLYGGKMPSSVHGTGPGNNDDKLWLIDQIKKNKANASKNFSEEMKKFPMRHAMPAREVAIAVHWLEAHFSFNDDLSCVTESKITELFMKRLHVAYGEEKNTKEIPYELPHSPRPNTGVHIEIPTGLTSTMKVFCAWQDNDMAGVDYHFSRDCKLLPKWSSYGNKHILGNRPGPVDVMEASINITDGILPNPADIFRRKAKPCRYCWKGLITLPIGSTPNPPDQPENCVDGKSEK